jgi:putative flippase GtrA
MRNILSKSPDIRNSAIVGFIIAVLFLILYRTAIKELAPYYELPLYYWGSLVLFPALSALGIFTIKDLVRKFGDKFGVFFQFYKFVLIGVLNTLLDLTILNALITLTAVSTGWQFSLFKGISFAFAIINSYFWNKLWTFKISGGVRPIEFSKFLAISLVGLGMNVGIASLLVNVIGAPEGISKQLWANVAAISAIGFSTIWNFAGYKIFVFKRK